MVSSTMHKSILFISVVILISLVLRLLYFTGMALGDDVFYMTQALSLAETGRWPPEPYHWNTRLGVILPTVLSIKTLGVQPLAFVLWPLLASTSSVLVCYLVANELVGPSVARVAAIFQAAFPLEVIYSTHLFPDVLVALFSTLSLWCWIRALRRGYARDFLASGVFLAAGYLCRETVIMEGPVYLALWLLAKCPRQPRILWALLGPVLIVSIECGVYAITAGSACYRWNAILAQQRNPGNLTLIQSSVSGGNFWTDPLLMIVANEEFGLYHVASFLVALVALTALACGSTICCLAARRILLDILRNHGADAMGHPAERSSLCCILDGALRGPAGILPPPRNQNHPLDVRSYLDRIRPLRRWARPGAIDSGSPSRFFADEVHERIDSGTLRICGGALGWRPGESCRIRVCARPGPGVGRSSPRGSRRNHPG